SSSTEGQNAGGTHTRPQRGQCTNSRCLLRPTETHVFARHSLQALEGVMTTYPIQSPQLAITFADAGPRPQPPVPHSPVRHSSSKIQPAPSVFGATQRLPLQPAPATHSERPSELVPHASPTFAGREHTCLRPGQTYGTLHSACCPHVCPRSAF